MVSQEDNLTQYWCNLTAGVSVQCNIICVCIYMTHDTTIIFSHDDVMKVPEHACVLNSELHTC